MANLSKRVRKYRKPSRNGGKGCDEMISGKNKDKESDFISEETKYIVKGYMGKYSEAWEKLAKESNGK